MANRQIQENRGEKTWPPTGRNPGRQWGISVAARGEVLMAAVTGQRSIVATGPWLPLNAHCASRRCIHGHHGTLTRAHGVVRAVSGSEVRGSGDRSRCISRPGRLRQRFDRHSQSHGRVPAHREASIQHRRRSVRAIRTSALDLQCAYQRSREGDRRRFPRHRVAQRWPVDRSWKPSGPRGASCWPIAPTRRVCFAAIGLARRSLAVASAQPRFRNPRKAGLSSAPA